jgi:hypothetical protein
MEPQPPAWIDDVTSWVVTYAEAGRFGICRMLLWFGDEPAMVAMPHTEYARVERATTPTAECSPSAALAELWRHRLLPTERPSPEGLAPVLR